MQWSCRKDVPSGGRAAFCSENLLQEKFREMDSASRKPSQLLCNISDSLLKVELGEHFRRHACKPGTLPNAGWEETLQDVVFVGYKG